MKKFLSAKTVALSMALIILTALAFWIFWPQDDLSHLKKTADVTEGTEEAIRTVGEIVSAARSADPGKALMPFMFIKDKTELERITAPLLEKPEFGEIKVLGCTRLVASHRENIAVHVYSANRRKSYAFYFLKDRNGACKFSDLGFSTRRP